jgi:hypothetical protein
MADVTYADVLNMLDDLDKLEGQLPADSLAKLRKMQQKRDNVPVDVLDAMADAGSYADQIGNSSDFSGFMMAIIRTLAPIAKIGMGVLLAPDRWTAFFWYLWTYNQEIKEAVELWKHL